MSDGIYQKCGEIYLANSASYSFLCCYCNLLFSDFVEFQTHSLVHLDKLESEADLDITVFKSGKSESLETEVVNQEIQDNILSDITTLNRKEKNLGNGVENCHNYVIDSGKGSSEEEVALEINLWEDLPLETNSEVEKTCSHCKIVFKRDSHDIEKCLRIREIINKNKGDFIKLLREGILCCCTCKEYFDDHKKLYQHHIISNHCSSNNQCKICKFHTFMNSKIKSIKKSNVLFKDENKYKISSQNKTFKKFCKKCSLVFNLKAEYDLHVKTSHKGIENDEMTDGDTDDDLNNTAGRVKGEFPHECSMCERVFRTKSQKVLHMRIHTNERPYKCEICPAAFTVATNLKNHVIYKHTDDRPFVCDYEGCNATFKLADLKRQHEKRHLPANFQCEKCGNYYKTKFNLLKHQQSRHVDAKDWPHQCNICKKRFVWPEHLADHKRIHTGEKPFGCDLCPKFFRRRNALREHKKLHSDVKKYICRFCGKGFKQRAGYWGHMKRHPIMS